MTPWVGMGPVLLRSAFTVAPLHSTYTLTMLQQYLVMRHRNMHLGHIHLGDAEGNAQHAPWLCCAGAQDAPLTCCDRISPRRTCTQLTPCPCAAMAQAFIDEVYHAPCAAIVAPASNATSTAAPSTAAPTAVASSEGDASSGSPTPAPCLVERLESHLSTLALEVGLLSSRHVDPDFTAGATATPQEAGLASHYGLVVKSWKDMLPYAQVGPGAQEKCGESVGGVGMVWKRVVWRPLGFGYVWAMLLQCSEIGARAGADAAALACACLPLSPYSIFLINSFFQQRLGTYHSKIDCRPASLCISMHPTSSHLVLPSPPSPLGAEPARDQGPAPVHSAAMDQDLQRPRSGALLAAAGRHQLLRLGGARTAGAIPRTAAVRRRGRIGDGGGAATAAWHDGRGCGEGGGRGGCGCGCG